MRYYQCDEYPIEFVLSENIDKHFDSHNHVGHYVISVVMKSAVTVCLENRKSECHTGDLFIIPPYTMHSVQQKKDTRLLSMCIGTSFVEKTALGAAGDIIRDLLENMVKQGVIGAEQEEKLFASMQTVYSFQEKNKKEVDMDIKTLADKIIGHPELNFPIEALAAEVFVSKDYLIRKFKNCIGMTPHQFCIQNRIRKSQGMLDIKRTVGEISVEMGFYDQSHFDKAFQRIVGISPSEYIHSKNIMRQTT